MTHHNNKPIVGDTPSEKYEEGWERVFGKRWFEDLLQEYNIIRQDHIPPIPSDSPIDTEE